MKERHSVILIYTFYFIGSEVIDIAKIKERPGHYSDSSKPAGFDTKRIFVSPSVLYSGKDLYATPVK